RATSGHRRRGGPRTGGRSRGPVPPSLPRPSWPVRCGGSPPSAHRAPDCLRRTTPTGTGGHPRTPGRRGNLPQVLVGRRQVVGRVGHGFIFRWWTNPILELVCAGGYFLG